MVDVFGASLGFQILCVLGATWLGRPPEESQPSAAEDAIGAGRGRF